MQNIRELSQRKEIPIIYQNQKKDSLSERRERERERWKLSYIQCRISVMREIFIAAHGDSLREGKDCIKSLTSEMELSGVDLPKDVIAFFAKISVFFRMRHLNKVIVIKKKKNKECHSMEKKLKKL